MPTRVQTRTLLGASIILLLLLCSFVFFEVHRTYQLNQRNKTIDQLALIEEQSLSECFDLEEPRRTRCLLLSVKKSRDGKIAEYDLAAQQDMAFWALLLLILSGLSLSVSSMGVAALVWTFFETRKFNQSTSRAYLITEKFLVTKIFNSEDSTYFQLVVGFEVRNSGKTPAFDVTVVSRLGWNPLDKMLDWQPTSVPTSRGIVGPEQVSHQTRHLPHNFEDADVEDNIEAEATIWARGIIQYRDIYDQWWQHTFMWRLKDPALLLNSKLGPRIDPAYRDHGMSVYHELNDLIKIDAPAIEPD